MTTRVPEASLIHRGLGRVEFFDMTADEMARMETIRAELAEDGHERVSFHAPVHRPDWFPWVGVTCFFLSEDETRRETGFQLLEHTLELARGHDADYAVTHLTFGPTDTKDPSRAADLAAAATERMAALSREYATPIDVEFAAYTDAYNDPAAFADAVAPHPELGICVDVGHTRLGAELRGRDFMADVRALAPHARSMHLWNTTGPEHTKRHHHTPLHPDQKPDNGWIDIAAVMALILEHAPEVNVVFEYPVEAVTGDIRAGYDWVAEMVESAHF